MKISSIKKAQKKHCNNLLKKPNVVSVGYGYKTVKGVKTDKVCIVIGVEKKMGVSSLRAEEIVPQHIDGIETDIIEIGHVYALASKKDKDKKRRAKKRAAFDPKKKFRPAMPGISIGHHKITAGTFGCVVEKDDQLMILSNNHVLANSNDAVVGDDIYQPGPADGGTAADKIGTLYGFVPIDFGGGTTPPPTEPTCPIAKFVAKVINVFAYIVGSSHRLLAHRPLAGTNIVDAALALPTEEIIKDIVQIGVPVGVVDPVLGTSIQKYGRTTSYTTGEILQLGTTISVDYGASGVATFHDQIVAGNMSAGGDSGSAVLDMDKNLVGLLFAGSATSTIINPMGKVFELLNLKLAI